MLSHKEAIQSLGLPWTGTSLVGKAFVPPQGEPIPIVDPATTEQLGTIYSPDEKTVDEAVAIADKALDKLRNMSFGRRKRMLSALAEALSKEEETLSRLESLDAGMPQMFSRQFSTKALVRNLSYYAEWPDKIEGRIIPAEHPAEALNLAIYEPVGVTAAIIPWNTPNLFIGSKIGPALAAGCPVILKPAERASLAAIHVAKIVQGLDLPEGAVQVLVGDATVGEALVRHPGVSKIAFTGGSEIGKKVMQAAAGSLKRLSLELGGKSPHILFEDADTEKALMLATFGVFSLSGQACAAGSRLFLHERIHDDFLSQVAAMAASLKVGDPLAGDTMLGPLISEGQLARVRGFVEEAEREGAQVVLRGQVPEELQPGYFHGPTILAGLDQTSRVVQEEIFGPVLTVFRFKTEDEAVAMANDTKYGLAAGIWTKDLSRAHRVAQKLEAGNVWVNAYGNLPYTVPFGGFKESGFGKDGGEDALYEHLRLKNVYIKL